jgi:hypothetical protein
MVRAFDLESTYVQVAVQREHALRYTNVETSLASGLARDKMTWTDKWGQVICAYYFFYESIY